MNRPVIIDQRMPPRAPLEMPKQDLRRHTPVVTAPTSWKTLLYRLAVFVPALITTGLLIGAFVDWMSNGGLNAVEMLLICLVGLTFMWISLYVSSASLGFLAHFSLLKRAALPQQDGDAMSVALLVPMYHEAPGDVFGNLAAMAQDLAAAQTSHSYDIFFLSDTQDAESGKQERVVFDRFCSFLPHGINAYYRRREVNKDKKSGNIADWLTNWGGAYDAMLVLDADSLMSASAVTRLTDAMASDPRAGLVQSQPQLYAGQSLFARTQQFAGAAYGFILAKGLSLWSGKEGNFWGHNAIIRTRAFAETAGLPKIRGLRSRETLILSHDIVEAALLRRGGWSVRFLPEIKGSYEEAPANLVDFAIRDRRWCYGNMQHMRILGSKGLHWVSRFHLLHGAMGYLMSPVWFLLLIIWVLLGRTPEANPITYFSAQNPLYPMWPENSMVNSFGLLLFMYSMLLLPKLLGIITCALTPGAVSGFGGPMRLGLSFLTEVACSIAYAPILMIQQSIAVIRAFIGIPAKWAPQQRQGGQYSVLTLFKFHALETLFGTLIIAGMGLGIVSIWLLPIGLSLLLSVPLSALSGLRPRGGLLPRWIMSTPDDITPPQIMKASRHWRTLMGGTAHVTATTERPKTKIATKPQAA
ncbi:Glucans biosynthesis glucosyltransferase H [Roseovarius albus]|uniref:Glucans biosynthesis glucosyltransferase H n=1 Tax=Roseovarius albus TaxID=1247867 RepID=A0A1X6YME4_9RHOB|nr:glucans biosynthesis glucosyltransferase MdoH [Roseovarius albus]SLN24989.1 Glucans biosynthesis glucosyltransferase H [Roseovarius albus]